MNDKTPKNEETPAYFEARFSPKQREALLGLLDGHAVSTVMRNAIGDAVRTAQQFEKVPIKVDWRKIEQEANAAWEKLMEEAERRGSTIADYLWDCRGRA